MVDFKGLLDAVVAALGRTEPQHGNPPSSTGRETGQEARQSAGYSPDRLLLTAKNLLSRHPGLTQAALLGLAGLMLGRQRKGGLRNSLVSLGGLAIIGGIAYRAFQGGPAERPALPRSKEPSGGTPRPEAHMAPADVQGVPETSQFHSVSQTEDDALLFLRAMVAAAASDGRIDEVERAQIIKGLTEAGIDPQASRWLEEEMASPADVDELAASVNDPDKAAQVYAAARIAIEPDTIQERDFLHRLAEALDLDASVRAQIDDMAASLR